jgi:predicted enzyme related to lactoylglutathione lyase
MTTNQPNLISALARIYVDDLDVALAFYRQLVGEDPHVFGFRDLRLAKIGVFLLIEGADSEVRSHAATIAVRDLDQVANTIEKQGGVLMDGPVSGPNGPRLIACHTDGTVIEYIQIA